MPALEETGLISVLDKLVWDQVLPWISDRLAHGRACVPVSINVSRVDVLSFDVADLLSGLLEKYAVPPEKIRVEITESACMESNKAIRKLTERLHETGVMVHMDDFGTGHSSLGVLGTMDIDALKLDREFIKGDVQNDMRRVKGVRSILAVADALNVPRGG